MLEQFVILGSLLLVFDEAGVDKVCELVRVVPAVVARIKAWWITMHDLLKLIEDRVPFGVGKLACGYLDESDTQ